MEKLSLSGSELNIFAVIYSFYKLGGFSGSREYLAKSAGVSLRAVTDTLRRLCDKGVIVKRQDEERWITYHVASEYVGLHEKGEEETSLGEGRNFPRGAKKFRSEGEETSHNNKEDNKEYNKAIYSAPERRTRSNNYKRNEEGRGKRGVTLCSPFKTEAEHNDWIERSFEAALNRTYGIDR